jgi:integrase
LIGEFQTRRTSEGVSGRSVNLEVGLLRHILRRAKLWSRMADDVERLPVKSKEIRVLTPEEKARLIETAASKPVRQVAYSAAVLALNTTMRGCELRGLRWRDIDLFEKVLRIRRQSTKTDAGTRVIPLNRDAVLALGGLWERSRNLNAAEPEHFVFPACMRGYIDPAKPMKNWKTSWRSLTGKAGLEGLRFHDLRHQAITELAEGGLSDQTIMSLAGRVSREMLNHSPTSA